MVRRTRIHSSSSLGSKTTQLVLALMDSSRKMNRRRTLTYFHSGLELAVRAPQTRMPWPGNRRMRFTPLGLSISCSAVLYVTARPVQLATVSLAGALWTPRVLSLRA